MNELKAPQAGDEPKWTALGRLKMPRSNTKAQSNPIRPSARRAWTSVTVAVK
jgi:hypothetical protein